MTIQIYYKEGCQEDIFGNSTYIRRFQKAKNILVGCNCITIYADGEAIHIPFDEIEKFTVSLNEKR